MILLPLIAGCAQQDELAMVEASDGQAVVEARVTGNGWWDPVRVVLADGSVPEPWLTDADGDRVPLTELSDDLGTYAWRAADALAPGDYYLTGADGGQATNPVAFNVSELGQLEGFDAEVLEGRTWRMDHAPWTPDGWDAEVFAGLEISIADGLVALWLDEQLLDEGTVSADERGLVTAELGSGQLRFGVDAEASAFGGLEGVFADEVCDLHDALGLDDCVPLVFHAGTAEER